MDSDDSEEGGLGMFEDDSFPDAKEFEGMKDPSPSILGEIRFGKEWEESERLRLEKEAQEAGEHAVVEQMISSVIQNVLKKEILPLVLDEEQRSIRFPTEHVMRWRPWFQRSTSLYEDRLEEMAYAAAGANFVARYRVAVTMAAFCGGLGMPRIPSLEYLCSLRVGMLGLEAKRLPSSLQPQCKKVLEEEVMRAIAGSWLAVNRWEQRPLLTEEDQRAHFAHEYCVLEGVRRESRKGFFEEMGTDAMRYCGMFFCSGMVLEEDAGACRPRKKVCFHVEQLWEFCAELLPGAWSCEDNHVSYWIALLNGRGGWPYYNKFGVVVDGWTGKMLAVQVAASD